MRDGGLTGSKAAIEAGQSRMQTAMLDHFWQAVAPGYDRWTAQPAGRTGRDPVAFAAHQRGVQRVRWERGDVLEPGSRGSAPSGSRSTSNGAPRSRVCGSSRQRGVVRPDRSPGDRPRRGRWRTGSSPGLREPRPIGSGSSTRRRPRWPASRVLRVTTQLRHRGCSAGARSRSWSHRDPARVPAGRERRWAPRA